MKHTKGDWKQESSRRGEDIIITSQLGYKSIALVHNHSGTAGEPAKAETEAGR